MSIDDLADQRGLQNAKVLTLTDEFLGLPSKIFISGLALAIGLGATVHFILGLIIALAYFPAMYHVHKDDPKGLAVWRAAILRKESYWVAGRQKQTKLILLSH